MERKFNLNAHDVSSLYNENIINNDNCLFIADDNLLIVYDENKSFLIEKWEKSRE